MFNNIQRILRRGIIASSMAMGFVLIMPLSAQAAVDYCNLPSPINGELLSEQISQGNRLQTFVRIREGVPVKAIADGTVVRITRVKSAEEHNARRRPARVVIQHDNGLRSNSAQLSRVDVEKGMRVRAGNKIGLSGGVGRGSYRSSGAHLTFHLKDMNTFQKLDSRCLFN